MKFEFVGIRLFPLGEGGRGIEKKIDLPILISRRELDSTSDKRIFKNLAGLLTLGDFGGLSILLLLFIMFLFSQPSYSQILLPIATPNRQNIFYIKLTEIGQFGLPRKARKNVPAHYHTGIDIKRPNNNYFNEPIFPIAEGIIISKRTDGPYAQLIVQHKFGDMQFWSVYEHIAGIKVNVNDLVEPNIPIARFMNKNELNKLGWQFDHFHLEIIKVKPIVLKPDKNHPQRYYNSYSLICFSPNDLQKYFYNPLEFLKTWIPPKHKDTKSY